MAPTRLLAGMALGVAAEVAAAGQTMVPLRFISQALGAQVGWDASTQTVTITYSAP